MSRLLVLLCFLCSNAYVHAEVILRRDTLGSIQGEIQSAGKTGLLLITSENQNKTVRIPWSSIIEIQPKKNRPNIDALLIEGKQIWRAKNRLLRGDIQLALPLLESQFMRLSGTGSSDTRLVTEGLLRALLAQGLIDKAVIPWLETVRLEEAGFASPYNMLDPILEKESLLCRHLPIMALQLIENNKLDSYAVSHLPKTKFFAQLVEQGVEEGSSFAQQILRTSSGNEEASSTLLAQYGTLEEWQKVWVNYAHFLFAKSKQDIQNAKLYLATVAAVDPTVQPYLTGMAMVQLADILESEQKLDEARRIRYEMNHLFPSHPYFFTNTNKGK